MGTGFQPYLCRLGDEPNPDEGYRFGREIDLVEIPVSWALDDWPYFEVVFEPDPLVGLSSRARSRCGRRMYGHVPGGLFTATFHPQVIGHDACMMMLEGLIDHIGATPGIAFKTVKTVVEEFSASHEPKSG